MTENYGVGSSILSLGTTSKPLKYKIKLAPSEGLFLAEYTGVSARGVSEVYPWQASRGPPKQQIGLGYLVA